MISQHAGTLGCVAYNPLNKSRSDWQEFRTEQCIRTTSHNRGCQRLTRFNSIVKNFSRLSRSWVCCKRKGQCVIQETRQTFCQVPRTGRREIVYGAWKWSQQVRPVIRQNGLTGSKPVVIQHGVGSNAIRNREREAGIVTAIVGGTCCQRRQVGHLMPQANMEGQACGQERGRCENLSEEGPMRIVMGDCPMNAAKGAVVVEERGRGNEGAHHCESHPFCICSVQHVG